MADTLVLHEAPSLGERHIWSCRSHVSLHNVLSFHDIFPLASRFFAPFGDSFRIVSESILDLSKKRAKIGYEATK
jgi:hypothetical protein